MPNYRRVWVPGGTYFFTVNLLERRRSLLTDPIDSLRDAFAQAKAMRPFLMHASVVLPDHPHRLWRLPPDDDDIATRWRHIKTTFSRSLPKTERLSERRRRKYERGIWKKGQSAFSRIDEESEIGRVNVNPDASETDGQRRWGSQPHYTYAAST